MKLKMLLYRIRKFFLVFILLSTSLNSIASVKILSFDWAQYQSRELKDFNSLFHLSYGRFVKINDTFFQFKMSLLLDGEKEAIYRESSMIYSLKGVQLSAKVYFPNRDISWVLGISLAHHQETFASRESKKTLFYQKKNNLFFTAGFEIPYDILSPYIEFYSPHSINQYAIIIGFNTYIQLF